MRAEGKETVRRILCVFPRYTSSFGTLEHAYPLTDGVQAFMPPQGLLLIAAYLPADWQVRFIDENIRTATPDDFAWAEAVFVSGMHIQQQQMNDIGRRAHDLDLAAAIGGPSVSACPEYYPVLRLSACRRTWRRHRRFDRAAGARSVAARAAGRAEDRRPSRHDGFPDPGL